MTQVIIACGNISHKIDVSWWRHQMVTFSALLALCVGNSPVAGEFPSQRPVTRGFGVSLICALISGWVNNREAGDLRRHRAHYELIVMCTPVKATIFSCMDLTLRWCHNEHDGVSNYRRLECLLSRLFMRRSKKTSKLCVTSLSLGIHRWPVDFPHKGPVMRKIFPFRDVIMTHMSAVPVV